MSWRNTDHNGWMILVHVGYHFHNGSLQLHIWVTCAMWEETESCFSIKEALCEVGWNNMTWPRLLTVPGPSLTMWTWFVTFASCTVASVIASIHVVITKKLDGDLRYKPSQPFHLLCRIGCDNFIDPSLREIKC